MATKDFFAPPALSLTLAGIFRSQNPEAEEESVGDGKRQRDDIPSSDNSGPVKSPSDDYLHSAADMEDEQHSTAKKKKAKNYHRHTADQIREMEALFKESPHPDERQRQQLSKELGLAPRQVKFWFQNRRTQIKAIQERHENSLLRSEIEKLREENKSLRESVGISSCSNCGFSVTSQESQQFSHQTLHTENVRLKAELDKLRPEKEKDNATGLASFQCVGMSNENKIDEDVYNGIVGQKKSKIMEMVEEGVEELKAMATWGDPLWVTNLETGREILNYDEYLRMFGSRDNITTHHPPLRQSIEASRESAVVFVDILHFVRSFIDVDLWKEMFPFIISKATIMDIMEEGEKDDNKNGNTQLMFAELHMLTPMVPVREVYFVRHCRRIGRESWIIVDISIDRVESGVDTSLVNCCKKRPSGCIIEDKANGHCKVIWVEHLESENCDIPLMYKSVVNSCQAFGATHWITTLKLQCERLAFFRATNIPIKDSVGVSTLAGRKSILRLAQRMTRSFCHVLGASNNYTWMQTSEEESDDTMKVASRINLNNLGEPIGVLICVATSLWLPVSPFSLFEFLKDYRSEWDVGGISRASEGSIRSIASLVKGQDRGNVVTIQAMAEEEEEGSMWVLQDCCTNGKESMIVYAHVDISKMQAIMEGCHSSDIAILPSGFSIIPDGIEPHPLLTTTTTREEKSRECGSLLTIAFQSHVDICPQSKMTNESVERVGKLISIILQNIRRGLHCERRMI